ncbi:uncharacterized protein LOC62_05G007783 [Vanrija pseudolonga]|uniref:Uncharacterized protein n=1 Tax=Vanrija pseudolonga TaxID=143232 RepID=A0AAF0YIL6_9TREE|nr:hypothetical protein LOC62_05G007783 [Vanrija pseudolonga]
MLATTAKDRLLEVAFEPPPGCTAATGQWARLLTCSRPVSDNVPIPPLRRQQRCRRDPSPESSSCTLSPIILLDEHDRSSPHRNRQVGVQASSRSSQCLVQGYCGT